MLQNWYVLSEQKVLCLCGEKMFVFSCKIMYDIIKVQEVGL